MKTKTTGFWPLLYVTWYEEPPRRRTVLVKNSTRPRRVEFPHMVFAAAHVLWFCTSLHVCRRDDGELCRIYLPNMGATLVCLGSASLRVRLGLLNPVTAFWNTAWEAPPRESDMNEYAGVMSEHYPFEFLVERTLIWSGFVVSLGMVAVGLTMIGWAILTSI